MTCCNVRAGLAALCMLAAACKAELSASATTTGTTAGSDGASGDDGVGPGSGGGDGVDGGPTSGPGDDGVDPDETGTPPPPGDAIYSEDFEGADGSAWPAPWMAIGNGVLASELAGGRGRLSGQTGTVARMALPGFDEVDVDITVVVEFESYDQQGFGFYARQNGGALDQTPTPGQGYAVYVEGGFQRAIGVWRETGGVEELLASTTDPIGSGLASGTPYAIRYQCQQSGDSTALRIKIWPADAAEPGAWQLEHTDATPELQNTSGSFAADLYNYEGTGSIFVHSVEISAL